MALTRIQPSALDQTLNYTANTFTANYITFADGTTQTTAGGGSATPNAAFLQANSAASFANAAFTQANSAYDEANSAASFANGAFVTANSGASFANSAFTVANNALPKSGGTITSDLTIQGNLSILGTSTTIYTTSIETYDSLIYLANNNITSDAIDIGIIGHYNSGVDAHSGIFRDPNLKEWIFFQGYTPEVGSNNLINISHPSFAYANVYANTFKGDLVSNTIYLNGYNTLGYINSAYSQANASYSDQNITASFANSSFITANSAASFANGAFTTANLKFNTSGGTITGSTTINANLIITGANVSLGNVANVHVYGGNTGQVLSTDNLGNLSFVDLPTTNTVTYNASTLSLTNGVYVSGSVTDIQVLNDGNAYQITDGTGTGPAWIIQCSFTGVVSFNRVVANINYTASSGHTIYFQVYNNSTSVWDNIGSYSGASGYTQYALEVLGSTSYIGGGTVQARLYHSNAGNAGHTTLLDYFALEKSAQGAQGPRGATGATGSTGATGNGVSSGGSTGQVLIKNSSTDYDTAWSNNLIDAYSTANSAASFANGAFISANSAASFANAAFVTANSAAAFANAAFVTANSGASFSNGAFISANSAAAFANAAYAQANAAYAQANTGGGSASLGTIITSVQGWNLP